MSLFSDSELVFTRNAKDNTYMGGGYVLKSEFMESGAPPLINMKMGGGSDGSDGGGNSSDGTNKRRKGRRNNIKNKKVSSLLFHGTRAVPAGLFLMNNRQSDAQSIYDDSRIKSVLNLNNDGSSSSNDGSSSDGSSSDGSNGSSNSKTKSGGNHHRRHNNAAVVPESLYDTLLKMLAPDADKRRYWANGAKTQRRGRGHSTNNKNTRKK
jgi:hypothetical protein